jgi:hypothetical protein
MVMLQMTSRMMIPFISIIQDMHLPLLLRRDACIYPGRSWKSWRSWKRASKFSRDEAIVVRRLLPGVMERREPPKWVQGVSMSLMMQSLMSHFQH